MVTIAKLHNFSSDIWETCRVALSSRQPRPATASINARRRTHANVKMSCGQSRPRGDRGWTRGGRAVEPPAKYTTRTRQRQALQHRIEEATQLGHVCGCLTRKVGLDTIWDVPDPQAFLAGATTLGEPISCVRLGKAVVRRDLGYDEPVRSIEVEDWNEAITCVFPGPVRVIVDNSYVGEVVMPDRWSLDSI